ncbi:MAG: glycosyltransferase family 2 protein, partial [Planctomycetota bacterium]
MGDTQTSISVIIPTYNEENAIVSEVESLERVLNAHAITYEIVVVDDGSSDKTVELALQTGARVMRHETNRGYGASLKSGINAAKYETIAIIDADGTYPADQIPAMMSKLQHADMVVGARTGKKVHIPWIRKPAKWILKQLANYIVGQKIPDLNSGLRVFRRDCVSQYFPVLSNRFSFTTTVTLALLSDDYRIAYHTIDYSQRIGKSKITPWHFMDFMILILRISMLFQPLKVFFPLSVSCGLLGILKVGFDVVAFFQRNPTLGASIFFNEI